MLVFSETTCRPTPRFATRRRRWVRPPRAAGQHDMDFYAAMQCLNRARVREEHARPRGGRGGGGRGHRAGRAQGRSTSPPRWRTTPYSSTEDFVPAWTRTRWRMTRQPNRWRRAGGGGAEGDAAATEGGAEVEPQRLRVLEMSQRLGEAPDMDDAPANVGARVGGTPTPTPTRPRSGDPPTTSSGGRSRPGAKRSAASAAGGASALCRGRELLRQLLVLRHPPRDARRRRAHGVPRGTGTEPLLREREARTGHRVRHGHPSMFAARGGARRLWAWTAPRHAGPARRRAQRPGDVIVAGKGGGAYSSGRGGPKARRRKEARRCRSTP